MKLIDGSCLLFTYNIFGPFLYRWKGKVFSTFLGPNKKLAKYTVPAKILLLSKILDLYTIFIGLHVQELVYILTLEEQLFLK